MHLVYLVGRDREVFSPVRRCLEDAGYPVCWFQHLEADSLTTALLTFGYYAQRTPICSTCP